MSFLSRFQCFDFSFLKQSLPKVITNFSWEKNTQKRFETEEERRNERKQSCNAKEIRSHNDRSSAVWIQELIEKPEIKSVVQKQHRLGCLSWRWISFVPYVRSEQNDTVIENVMLTK